ncbi:MAG: hypothetical protein ABSG32_23395 [Terriglobia bacterium]|jgi:hypothetical protein
MKPRFLKDFAIVVLPGAASSLNFSPRVGGTAGRAALYRLREKLRGSVRINIIPEYPFSTTPALNAPPLLI